MAKNTKKQSTTPKSSSNLFSRMSAIATVAADVVSLNDCPEENWGPEDEKDTWIMGVYNGPGALIPQKPDPSGDPQDPLVTQNLTHHDNTTSDVISAYQMDRDLPGKEGQCVAIFRAGQVANGAHRVNQYRVMFGNPGIELAQFRKQILDIMNEEAN